MSLFCDLPPLANHTTVVKVVEELAQYVTYVELAVGFVCQIINLVVLHGHRIRSLSYTTYLKVLSVNYLIAIPFFIPNFLLKQEIYSAHSYLTAFYYAHFDAYVINFFLFSGNLMVLALAAEPLRAITSPLKNLTVSPHRALKILLGIYIFTAIVLIPVIFFQEIGISTVAGPGANSTLQTYCIRSKKGQWMVVVRYAIAALFEISLITAVIIVYACLLYRYRKIVRRHQESVRQLTVTESKRLTNQNKAPVICFGCVAAYLISNLLSAVKEVIKLALFLSNNNAVKRADAFQILIHTVNIALLSNYALTFVLQYSVCGQYRDQLRKVLRRPRHAASNSCPSTPSTQARGRRMQERPTINSDKSFAHL